MAGAAVLKSSCFLQLNKKSQCPSSLLPCRIRLSASNIADRSFKPPMATLSTVPAVGLSETFSRLKKQGEAASTRSLARGTKFDKIIAMLKDVAPQLSCPIALFSYYNPILKRGVEKFMITVRDAGIHGLVVPDVPLEETEILRKEASKHKLELVLLTTPTTPKARMKAIAEASEGFVYLVSSVGVTGARASVSEHVQSLLTDIKEATSKPVAVGFGISKPEHVKQVAGWGADGVIVGSAMVRILGEAKSPEEGLKELEIFTKALKAAL